MLKPRRWKSSTGSSSTGSPKKLWWMRVLKGWMVEEMFVVDNETVVDISIVSEV